MKFLFGVKVIVDIEINTFLNETDRHTSQCLFSFVISSKNLDVVFASWSEGYTV